MRDSDRDAQVRLKAETVLAQRKKQEEEFVKQREKEREAVAAKVARLRELRLAQEAAEAQAKSERKVPSRRRR
jgi:hypothetical protein